MTKSKDNMCRGHEIYQTDDGYWHYVEDIGDNPPCGLCGMHRTEEGHDGCLGTLPDPNVMNACCGHGEAGMAYVQFWDGTERIADQDALDYFSRYGVGPPGS